MVIGADWNHYYANITRSFPVGEISERAKNAIAAMEEAYITSVENTKPGVRFAQVEREIEKIYT
ncbi:MAG: Uncharacterized protein XD43_0809, partial [Thermococcales archaeon 44_46]